MRERAVLAADALASAGWRVPLPALGPVARNFPGRQPRPGQRGARRLDATPTPAHAAAARRSGRPRSAGRTGSPGGRRERRAQWSRNLRRCQAMTPRLHEDERVPPTRPDPGEAGPQKAVGDLGPGSRMAPLENGELVT